MQALSNLRNYFFRGIAALLPTILTIWIIAQCYYFVQDNISRPINYGIAKILVYSIDSYPEISEEQKKNYLIKENPQLQGDTEKIDKKINDPKTLRQIRLQGAYDYWIYGKGRIAGFIVAIIAVSVFGIFLAGFIGRTLWHSIESTFRKLPIIKQIYAPLRQITDFLMARREISFNKVVAVQYPRKGVWSVGLATGKAIKKVDQANNEEFLSVFVPSSPTPFTGYVIMTRREDIIELDITVEEALRFTVSGGVITPSQSDEFEQFTGIRKETSNNEEKENQKIE